MIRIAVLLFFASLQSTPILRPRQECHDEGTTVVIMIGKEEMRVNQASFSAADVWFAYLKRGHLFIATKDWRTLQLLCPPVKNYPLPKFDGDDSDATSLGLE